MSATRTASRWLLWISVALLASPGLATAQNAVLYEVTETMKITRGGGSRQATAALMGVIHAGTSLCPAVLAQSLGIEQCSVAAYATDNIDLSTGHGPVKGTFAILIPGDNPVDAAELIIARGHISGRIDLSPAIGDVAPLGTLTGTWSAKGVNGGPLAGLKVEGTVEGVFRLPFVWGWPEPCLRDGDPADCLYVSKPSYWMDTHPVELGDEQKSLGAPTVRLELKFTETSRKSRNRDDD